MGHKDMCAQRLRSAMRGGEIKTYGCFCEVCGLLDEACDLHSAELAARWLVRIEPPSDAVNGTPVGAEFGLGMCFADIRALRNALASLDQLRAKQGGGGEK